MSISNFWPQTVCVCRRCPSRNPHFCRLMGFFGKINGTSAIFDVIYIYKFIEGYKIGHMFLAIPQFVSYRH
jgi:hypothetical protein